MDKVAMVTGMEVMCGLNHMDLPFSRLILPRLLLRANLLIPETSIQTHLRSHRLQGPASHLAARSLQWTLPLWAGAARIRTRRCWLTRQQPEPGEGPFPRQCPSSALEYRSLPTCSRQRVNTSSLSHHYGGGTEGRTLE